MIINKESSMKLKTKYLTLFFGLLATTAVLHGCSNRTEEVRNAHSAAKSNVTASKPIITSAVATSPSSAVAKEDEIKEEEPLYKLYPVLTGEIDVYEEKVKPGKRNFKANWDEKIFYGLEKVKGRKKGGKLKNYEVLRKTLINKNNRNRMEYEIYRNPKTGKINKIVSIEYRKKDLELTDYYYIDEGKINFIYQRKDSIYTPTYASPDKTGSRYYFNKDSLIKWRWETSRLM